MPLLPWQKSWWKCSSIWWFAKAVRSSLRLEPARMLPIWVCGG
ncbi:hypothetical protein ACFOWZ_06565 [Lentzea rhizosphaerae]|uniref:Uncharacterized protein n=1 Tax=Lentzea rhizosphaerae TaxID=2041025 RepID=A0ABV8BPM5_9PSEU